MAILQKGLKWPNISKKSLPEEIWAKKGTEHASKSSDFSKLWLEAYKNSIGGQFYLYLHQLGQVWPPPAHFLVI